MKTSFKFLAGSSILANLSDGLAMASLPLLALTWTTDPRDIALIAFLRTLPWFLFTLPVGFLLDKIHPITILRISSYVRFFVSLFLLLSTFFIENLLYVCYIYVFLVSVSEVFFDSALQITTPLLVNHEELSHKNGFLFTMEILMNNIIGSMLGAFLIQKAIPFYFLCFALTLWCILKIPYEKKIKEIPLKSRNIIFLIKSTLLINEPQYFWKSPTILKISISGALGTCSWQMVMCVLSLIVVKTFGYQEHWLGFFLLFQAFGGTLGALSVRFLEKKLEHDKLFLFFAIGIPLSWSLLFLFQNPFVLFLSLWGIGFSSMGWMVCSLSLRQRALPQEYLGRINGLYRFFVAGAQPLGAFLGGILFAKGDLPFVLGGSLFLSSLAVFIQIKINTKSMNIS